jgi:hypothetical protein
MRILGLSCCIALVVGCARTGDDAGTDSAAGATETAAATISLADVAGTWNVTSTPVTGDTTATTYVLTATAETTGWTITFPNRPPVATRIVSVAGDSIVMTAGPFESVRRRGVQVTTHSILRKEGDRLVGVTHASYATTGADTALMLRTEGTRAP